MSVVRIEPMTFGKVGRGPSNLSRCVFGGSRQFNCLFDQNPTCSPGQLAKQTNPRFRDHEVERRQEEVSPDKRTRQKDYGA